VTEPFVHLHVHSEYSLLDGAIRCSALAAKAAEWGSPAVALTDHGAMYGIVEFYEKCLSAGVKPLLGCETYIDPLGHTCRDRKGGNNHLVLLARDLEGYHNLVKLVSIANTEGFYYKPRIDHDLLARYSKGLIASSACLAGEIPSMILEGNEKGAEERATLYQDIMGKGNFYLEIMHNALPEQALVNKGIIRISRRTGIPLVATNDAHYLNASDSSWHDVLLCVQTNATVDEPNRYRFGSSDFYLRSPSEMWTLFGRELPEALTNTVEVAEKCDVKLDFNVYRLPRYEVPEGENLESYLEKLAWEGLEERMNGSVPGEYRERMAYELGVIRKMGFSGYFLVVSDFIRAAKSRGIPVGPGRGSAAGSLAAWALRITELDPIRYHLLFERFLNPERISMPDIDTDISDKRRDEVLEYVVEKYGRTHVAQIITFDRMKSKGAIRDVGRALGVPLADVNRVAKSVPEGAASIHEAIEASPDLAEFRKKEPAIRNLLEVAGSIEGLARHCSQHAAGVVISPVEVTELVPVRKIGDGQVVTQFGMEAIEKLGLVKMDFLGLRTLSMIEDTLENIRLNGKEVPDINAIPLGDPLTFGLLQGADTLGVFQLESPGMRQLLKRMVPDSFEDLVAILALYRPGPLGSGMVDQFINCKHGRSEVVYPHPSLEPCLRETYGVVLYQEQVMQIAATLGGFSLGEADLLRRAMGKKKVEVMEQQRKKFVEGCLNNGVEESTAESIFDLIQEFAGYGFNKSHSAAYALISYQTAYLKAHYKAEFLAAFLSSQIGSRMDVLARYVREVRNAGTQVLPPDVNESGASFSAVGKVIRFGLKAVAKAGETAVEAILKARQSKGTFQSLWDFLNKVDLRTVNRGVIENLVKSGAFDSLHPNRRQLLENLPMLVDRAQKKQCEGAQRSLLALVDDLPEEEPRLDPSEDFSLLELLDLEKEVLGLFISGHPLEREEERISRFTTCRISDLSFWKAAETPAIIGGLLLGFREKTTKRGDLMGILEFEDTESKVEVVCFPKSWPAVKGILDPGKVFFARGKVQDRGGVTLIAEEIIPLAEIDSRQDPFVRIRLRAKDCDLPFKAMCRELKGHPGSCPVLVEYVDEASTAVVRLRDIRVKPETSLSDRLAELSGGAVEVIL
jgi:DNA polymerase-3 subunit alpha